MTARTLPPIPEHYHLLYSKSQIHEQIHFIAHELREWIDSSSHGKAEGIARPDVVAVPILRGSLFFSADLLRALARSLEIRPMITSTYSSNAEHRPLRELACDFFGYLPRQKRVLLIDDMCDSGSTLARVKDFCLREGAHEVKTAVLIYRGNLAHVPRLVPDFKCFTYDDSHWLVGYGLDDDEKNRHLEQVYAL
jgi:hypoxanthine phosphoribosyltransferase